MVIPIKNYADMQARLDAFVASSGVTPGLAPHATFWHSLSYEQFISPAQPVPNVPSIVPILVVGDSKNSNIIRALSGTPGSPFDPNSGSIGQMPQPNPPYNAVPPTQNDTIDSLADWIDRGCPND